MFKQKTIYLSLSQSRQWSAEMPIGDPFGGPAYGKRELFGLIGAAVSIFSGASAFSLAAGFTLANIAAGAAIIGGALTIVGTLTGDKSLANIGSVIGLGGAAVGFISGGGLDTISNFFGGEGASAAGAAAEGVAGAGSGIVAPGEALANIDIGNQIPINTVSTPVATPSGIYDVVPPSVPQVDAGLLAPGSITTGTDYAMQAADPYGIGASISAGTGSITQPMELPTVGLTQASGATGASQAIDGFDSAELGYATKPTSAGGATDASKIPSLTEPPGAGSGVLGKIDDFFSKNDKLINIVGKAGAALFDRLSPSEKTKAETLLAQASAGSKEAETELMKTKNTIALQQAANANSVVNPGQMANTQYAPVGLLAKQMPTNTYQPRAA